MPSEEEVFDDIAARIAALEFIVRQILSTQLRGTTGDPLEKALAHQMAAATMLRENLDKMEEGHPKGQMRQLNIHIARIYEDLIRGMEAAES